jgi:hypothetical protein
MEKSDKLPERSVTLESLTSAGSIAGKQIREIKEKFPKTADALILHSQLLEDQVNDDAEVLLAKQMAMDHEYYNERNPQNLIKNYLLGKEARNNPKRVQAALDKLVELSEKQDPDSLFKVTDLQAQIIRDKLLSDTNRPKIKVPLLEAIKNIDQQDKSLQNLLARYKGFFEAQMELAPHLTEKLR